MLAFIEKMFLDIWHSIWKIHEILIQNMYIRLKNLTALKQFQSNKPHCVKVESFFHISLNFHIDYSIYTSIIHISDVIISHYTETMLLKHMFNRYLATLLHWDIHSIPLHIPVIKSQHIQILVTKLQSVCK